MALALLVIAEEATATERQLHVGLGVGLMTLEINGFRGNSIGLEGNLIYELTDQFNVIGEFTLSPHTLVRPAPSPCPDPPEPCVAHRYAHDMMAMTGAVGASYKLDVGRWVPYFGALVGVLRATAGDGSFAALQGTEGYLRELDIVLAGGLDYQLFDWLNVGLAGRLHQIVQNDLVSYSSYSLRAQYTW